MDKRVCHSWMIAPRSFVRLIGAEYDLLSEAGKSVLTKFYVSAVLIVIILTISCLSIYHAVDALFSSQSMEIGFSIFFSVLFVFIYIFLLNTFTKQQVDSANRFFKLSNFVRTGFVVFMAFIISKPIEIYIFNDALETEVQAYKNFLIENYRQKIDASYSKQLNMLYGKESLYQSIRNTGSTIQSEISDINQNINEMLAHKKQIVQAASERIMQSSFFTFQIQQLALKHKASYLVCLCIILLFLLPGFIIYNISKDNLYYKIKNEYERNLILNNYEIFLRHYKHNLFVKFGVQTDFHTVYQDPPFNTKRKSDNHYQPETEFFKKYG